MRVGCCLIELHTNLSCCPIITSLAQIDRLRLRRRHRLLLLEQVCEQPLPLLGLPLKTKTRLHAHVVMLRTHWAFCWLGLRLGKTERLVRDLHVLHAPRVGDPVGVLTPCTTTHFCFTGKVFGIGTAVDVRQHMKVVQPELNVTSFPVTDFSSTSASQTMWLWTLSRLRACTRIDPSSTRKDAPMSKVETLSYSSNVVFALTS